MSNNISKLQEKLETYTNMSESDWTFDELSTSYSSKQDYINELKSKIDSLDETTTTSAVPGVMTPYAFSKKNGNIRAAKQLGYKLAGELDKNDNLKESSYEDEEGLTQHNDPDIDPNAVTYKDTIPPMTEKDNKYTPVVKEHSSRKDRVIHFANLIVSNRKKLREGLNKLRFEQDGSPQDPTVPADAPVSGEVETINVQDDFTDFDKKLKASTEALKTQLQDSLLKKLQGKKIVVRASKGYKQPESDYTVNVTGVQIDYYYERYVIIIVGREENKQKTYRFFIKPGYKIKVLGDAENLKPKDRETMDKFQKISDPSVERPTDPKNNVTSDNDSEVPEAPDASPQVKGEPQSSPDQGNEPEVQPDQSKEPSQEEDPRNLRKRLKFK